MYLLCPTCRPAQRTHPPGSWASPLSLWTWALKTPTLPSSFLFCPGVSYWYLSRVALQTYPIELNEVISHLLRTTELCGKYIISFRKWLPPSPHPPRHRLLLCSSVPGPLLLCFRRTCCTATPGADRAASLSVAQSAQERWARCCHLLEAFPHPGSQFQTGMYNWVTLLYTRDWHIIINYTSIFFFLTGVREFILRIIENTRHLTPKK